MYPEICLRGLSRMIPELAVYLENIPRSTLVDGGYYTQTPDNIPLVGPASGVAVDGVCMDLTQLHQIIPLSHLKHYYYLHCGISLFLSSIHVSDSDLVFAVDDTPIVCHLLHYLDTCGALGGFGVMASAGVGNLLAKHICGDTLPDYAKNLLPARFESQAYLDEIASIGDTGKI